MNYWVQTLHDYIWGPPLLLFLLGTGAYLTFLLRGVQFRYLRFAIKQIFVKNNKSTQDQGDISQFEALMTTLAGAIGTGAIVGVSTAITIGGLGSLFWMWVAAFLGMATKYAESLLAVKYREKDGRGEMVGGPMQYIEKGIGNKSLAIIFAILGIIAVIGTGNLVQVNSIAEAVSTVWTIDPLVTGLIIATLTGMVIVGGVKNIGRFTGVLVPVMSLFYLLSGMTIIIRHIDGVLGALTLILKSAFSGQAAFGGFAGAGVLTAIQIGVARSVFSNEAGLGISSIASAAAKTDSPGKQAMISMTGAWISTLIVCTITGLVIAVTGVMGQIGSNGRILSGAALVIQAFTSVLGEGGSYIVTVGLILFAFSTVIAWAYYGEKCCEYLLGERSIFWYRLFFILMVIPGATLEMEMVWIIASTANGLMAIPNLIALLILSPIVYKETRKFTRSFKPAPVT